MPFLFHLGLFAYIFILSAARIEVDNDFWARLIVGKTFFQTGEILKYDFLSYGPTRQWYDHEWGSSVIFYFLQNNFGDTGLIIFRTILTFLTFFFIVKVIKLRRKNHLERKYDILNILFFIFAIQACADFIVNHVRCQFFTLFFFSMWIYILEKARIQKNYRLLWTLPATMLIWANLHGGCFIGLGLLGLYTVGEYLNKKPFLPYIYSGLASMASAFINPYGYKYVEFLFTAAFMHRPSITEWQGLFHKININTYFKFKFSAFILLSVVGVFLYKKYRKLTQNSFIEKIKKIYTELDKTKALILTVMFLLTIKSVRFIPFFTLCAIAYLYDDFYSIFSKKLPDKLNKAKEFLIYLTIFLCFGLQLVNISDEKITASYKNYPVAEVDFIKRNNIKGNILVNFHNGSYVAYKLYPNNHIFMDGRYEEVYDPRLLKEMDILWTGKHGYKEIFKKYHHDMIIVEQSYLLYYILLKDANWICPVKSKNYALFIKQDLYNSKKVYQMPPINQKEYDKTMWDSSIDWSAP